MSKYIYLSITPESLIGSMLTAQEFGAYMATGTKKRNKGQAIFFEVDMEQIKDLFDMDYLNRKLVTKTDGRPKHTVYLSVYKALEKIPLKALKNLYLCTDNGIVLELSPSPYDKSKEIKNELHLYQELCPVTPQIASKLSPSQFLKELTDGSIPIVLPKLMFVELRLGELAANPLMGSAEHLPYTSVGHLRDCLEILKKDETKVRKTVQRFFSGTLLYRTISSGFYIGSKDEIIYYRYPSMAELEDINYEFFRAI